MLINVEASTLINSSGWYGKSRCGGWRGTRPYLISIRIFRIVYPLAHFLDTDGMEGQRAAPVRHIWGETWSLTLTFYLRTYATSRPLRCLLILAAYRYRDTLRRLLDRNGFPHLIFHISYPQPRRFLLPRCNSDAFISQHGVTLR